VLLTRPLFGVFLDSFGSMPYYEYSITEEELASLGIEQRECRDMLKLDNYASLFTGFDRKHGFETIPEKFVRGEDKTPDSFDDEISLLLKEGNGYAMVVGCSHRGIVNMVSAVKERTGKQVVRVVGGYIWWGPAMSA